MLEHTVDPPVEPARVVIIGADGFVGSHLSARLRAEDRSVLGIATADIPVDDQTGQGLAASLRPNDAVVFAATRRLATSRDTAGLVENIRLGQSVCAALVTQPVAHLVYVSSEAVYPPECAHINESSCAAPHDLAGILHKTREVMLETVVKAPVAILRLASVFGADAGDDTYGPTRLMHGALAERTIKVAGAGEETRDHVLVDDACALIADILRRRSRGLANIASGHSVDFATLAHKIAALVDGPVDIRQMPRAAPITHRHFDITVLFKAFPRFAFTPLEQALGKLHHEMAERRQ